MCVCVCLCMCVSVCISLILRAHVYSCWCTERGSLHTHVTTFRRSSAFLPAIFSPRSSGSAIFREKGSLQREGAAEHRMALARGSRAQNLGIPVWSTVAFAGCTEYT